MLVFIDALFITTFRVREMTKNEKGRCQGFRSTRSEIKGKVNTLNKGLVQLRKIGQMAF